MQASTRRRSHAGATPVTKLEAWMSEYDVGPIDYIAVEFPDGQLKGEGGL